MSRELNVALVEAYLDCFVTKDLSKLSLAEDVTFGRPAHAKVDGAAYGIWISCAHFPDG